MTTGIAQPDALPLTKFRLDDVLCFEIGTALYPIVSPTCVIVAGNSFLLRTDLGFDGTMDSAYIGDEYTVEHHWQRIEDGAVGLLTPSPAATVPSLDALAHFANSSGPYTTGVSGSGADLEFPAGSTTGATFRITTHVHFASPNQANVAAFHDGVILMVVPVSS